jgi:hypothetical protein
MSLSIIITIVVIRIVILFKDFNANKNNTTFKKRKLLL